MNEDRELLWQLFLDTGDPLCWMLFRRGGKKPGGRGDGARPSRPE